MISLPVAPGRASRLTTRRNTHHASGILRSVSASRSARLGAAVESFTARRQGRSLRASHRRNRRTTAERVRVRLGTASHACVRSRQRHRSRRAGRDLPSGQSARVLTDPPPARRYPSSRTSGTLPPQRPAVRPANASPRLRHITAAQARCVSRRCRVCEILGPLHRTRVRSTDCEGERIVGPLSGYRFLGDGSPVSRRDDPPPEETECRDAEPGFATRKTRSSD